MGKGKARGQGTGPIGIPNKEQNTMSDINKLVDIILDGKYHKVKKIIETSDLVDVILDSYEKKQINEETEYQKFFNTMLKKYNVNSPNELEGEKKKEFFDAVDKGWKGDKEKVEEVTNAINNDPGEDAKEILSNIKDELGKERSESKQFKIKRSTTNEMKKKIQQAKLKCKSIKNTKERQNCILKHMKENIISDDASKLVKEIMNKVK